MSSLITAHVKCGKPQYALTLYQKISEDNSVHPSGLVALLKECARLQDIRTGHEIHADVARRGLLEKDLFLGSALMDMYARCGELSKARHVFDRLPVRNAVVWNALIARSADCGYNHEALKCYKQMQLEGVFPDAITFVCSLKACGSLRAESKGHEIHAEILRVGMIEKNVAIGNALVDMYVKCGSRASAQNVFDKLEARDIISWTTLIAGYAEHGLGREALVSFKQMQCDGIAPDIVTFVCSLKACGSMGAIDTGEEVHADIERRGLLQRHVVVGNTLVDMYAKCGLLARAQQVFDRLPIRTVVSWGVLIAGYAEGGHGEESLKCFEKMQHDGIFPDAVMFVSCLKACGSIGAVCKAMQLHVEIEKQGLLEGNIAVGNALIDMYVKCGFLSTAHGVFDRLPARNVVSWASLMTGHAQLGECANVIHIFNRMVGESMKPDIVSFGVVLSACSQIGFFTSGQTYFNSMSKDFGIAPTLVHHICMIDLFVRAGEFENAIDIMKNMPCSSNLLLWNAALDACSSRGKLESGTEASQQALHREKESAVAYALMCRLYAFSGIETRRQRTYKSPIYC